MSNVIGLQEFAAVFFEKELRARFGEKAFGTRTEADGTVTAEVVGLYYADRNDARDTGQPIKANGADRAQAICRLFADIVEKAKVGEGGALPKGKVVPMTRDVQEILYWPEQTTAAGFRLR
ncbi:MAG: hypothetical protein KGQ41_04940 [Alphaproteobacteria bacterium]|nr:hypothetical protein [Alphaproteobacteria bacterium]